MTTILKIQEASKLLLENEFKESTEEEKERWNNSIQILINIT